jgi:hypothetical protein
VSRAGGFLLQRDPAHRLSLLPLLHVAPLPPEVTGRPQVSALDRPVAQLFNGRLAGAKLFQLIAKIQDAASLSGQTSAGGGRRGGNAPAPAIFAQLLGGRGPLGLPGGPNRQKNGSLWAAGGSEISSRHQDELIERRPEEQGTQDAHKKQRRVCGY